jgi:hypothetical protein
MSTQILRQNRQNQRSKYTGNKRGDTCHHCKCDMCHMVIGSLSGKAYPQVDKWHWRVNERLACGSLALANIGYCLLKLWSQWGSNLLTPKITPSFWLGFMVDSMAIDSFLNSLLSLLDAKF